MNDKNASLRCLNPHLDFSEARQLMWDDLMTRTHDIFRGSGPDVTRRLGNADVPGGMADTTTPSTEEPYPTGSHENVQQVGYRCLTTPNYPVPMNDSVEAKTPWALNVDFKKYMHSQHFLIKLLSIQLNYLKGVAKHPNEPLSKEILVSLEKKKKKKKSLQQMMHFFLALFWLKKRGKKPKIIRYHVLPCEALLFFIEFNFEPPSINFCTSKRPDLSLFRFTLPPLSLFHLFYTFSSFLFCHF